MKKLLLVMLLLFNCLSYGADQWDKTQPLGTASPSDIDTLIPANNNAQDRVFIGYRNNCDVLYSSSSQLSVLSGQISIPNSAGTVVRYRANTNSTTVTWSDIDTGTEAVSMQYYVYAVADTDATTFTIKISTSSTAPKDITYYRLIGYFYNDASGNIISVGNIKGGNVVNFVSAIGTSNINTNSTSYIDMSDMVIYFYSSGGNVEIIFNAPVYNSNAGYEIYVGLFDGSTELINSVIDQPASVTSENMTVVYKGVLSAGIHTIKAKWYVSGFTAYQSGTAIGERILNIKEL